MAGRRRVAAAGGAALATELKALVSTAVMHEPNSFGEALRALRAMEHASLHDFAKRLGIPFRHLQDIEVGRRGVSVKRAGEWARSLGYPQQALVRLAIQRLLDDAGIPLKCKLEQPS